MTHSIWSPGRLAGTFPRLGANFRFLNGKRIDYDGENVDPKLRSLWVTIIFGSYAGTIHDMRFGLLLL